MNVNDIRPEVYELARQAEEEIRPQFERVDRIAMLNTRKVMTAFQDNKVSDSCFAGTTGYGYEVIRYFLVSSHYRSPINYSLEIIEQCKSALERLYTCRESLDFAIKNAKDIADDTELIDRINSRREQFIEAMDDDLNTADGVAAIFDLVKDINISILDKEVSKNVCQTAADVFDELCDVLGILYNRKSNDVDADIEALIEQRQTARANKDWATADRIRDELKAKGIILKDTPQGVTWTKE